MKTEPLPPSIEPHAWMKFQAAQTHFLRLIYHGPRTRKNARRVRKWALEMNKWINKLFRAGYFGDPYSVTPYDSR
jgi:hypothetical protein